MAFSSSYDFCLCASEDCGKKLNFLSFYFYCSSFYSLSIPEILFFLYKYFTISMLLRWLIVIFVSVYHFSRLSFHLFVRLFIHLFIHSVTHSHIHLSTYSSSSSVVHSPNSPHSSAILFADGADQIVAKILQFEH